MKVLIGCATSCVALDAFLRRGHDAWQCDLLPAEELAPIAGFPDYLASSLGRVISFHGKRPRPLSPAADQKGYLRVSLRPLANGGTALLHRVIASSFIANPNNLPSVRHLDGDPSNNAVRNLAWGTQADNEEDKRTHGTWDTRRTGKLVASDRETIRALYGEGWSQKALADLFDVSRPTITRLVNGSIWGNDHAA
jgi:hypothetical protein